MRVAVIGSGISGLSAAYGLKDVADVTVHEAEGRLGGHSATVDVPGPNGASIAVDTGFIVYNTLNYPNLTALFAELGVETHASDMSFAVSLDDGRFEWAGHEGKLWKLFAQPSNLLDPGYLWMLREVVRFNAASVADREAGKLAGLSIGDYLDQGGYSRRFRSDYLLPMGAAIWSTAYERMLDFPAESFVAFFANHRLLGFDRPVWRTVTGGSRRYVAKLAATLGDRIRIGTPVTGVRRVSGGVEVTDARGGRALYDHAIMACHADQSLALLSDATDAERSVLADVRYEANEVILHADASLMPRREAAWSSWNYLAASDTADRSKTHVTVTYWMNLLQGLDPAFPLFVTLNPTRAPDPAKVFGRYSYAHPQLDGPALAAQKRLPSIQGAHRVQFAGAWTAYGFHEDGLKSGIAAAEALGGRYSWRSAPSPSPLLEAAE